MREILFRGKTVSESEYFDEGYWIEGFYTRFNGKEHRIYTGFAETDCDDYYPDWDNVRPETVGQYTGLTDKNGKKIFEGDYWLDTDGDYLVYVVEFREGQFGFVCYGWQGVLMPYGFDENAGGFGEIDFSPMTDFNIDLIEIDGNIHDTPELLKGGAE